MRDPSGPLRDQPSPVGHPQWGSSSLRLPSQRLQPYSHSSPSQQHNEVGTILQMR